MKGLSGLVGGLGVSLGGAGIGAAGVVSGFVGLVGVGYMVRAVVKGMERDFDAMYVKASAAQEKLSGRGPDVLGGVFGSLQRGWHRWNDFMDKTRTAYIEMTGELLGGGSMDDAIRASNRVMGGSAESARKLEEQYRGLAKTMFRGDLARSLKDDFGLDLGKMTDQLKGFTEGIGGMFGGVADALRKALSGVDTPNGKLPPEQGWEEMLKNLGNLGGNVGESLREAFSDAPDVFQDARDSLSGFNDSLRETQNLMGAKVFKAGTLGSITGPTPRRAAQTGGWMSAPPRFAQPTPLAAAVASAAPLAVSPAASAPSSYWGGTPGGRKTMASEIPQHFADMDRARAGVVPSATLGYLSMLQSGMVARAASEAPGSALEGGLKTVVQYLDRLTRVAERNDGVARVGGY